MANLSRANPAGDDERRGRGKRRRSLRIPRFLGRQNNQ
jgi:hypothetical protein